MKTNELSSGGSQPEEGGARDAEGSLQSAQMEVMVSGIECFTEVKRSEEYK